MKNKNVRLVISISLNLILIIAGVYIIFTAGSTAYTFGHNIFDEESVDTLENARETEVTIPEHVSAKQLADIIYSKGLVHDKTIFYFQVILSDYKGKFVGGTYTLNTSMKPTEMMKVMCAAQEDEE